MSWRGIINKVSIGYERRVRLGQGSGARLMKKGIQQLVRNSRYKSVTRFGGVMHVCFTFRLLQSDLCQPVLKNLRTHWLTTRQRRWTFSHRSTQMKIADLRATTVTVPLEAPLRHANGCHWGRFVRTIVEVETDEGLVGLGEMGGGGESAEATLHALKSYLVGYDPARLEELRFLIANPTASLYNNRTQ